MNIKCSGARGFLGFHLSKVFSAAPIHNEHQETLETQGNFFKHSLPWFNEPSWPENK
jgi:hypothetical protein